MHGQMRALGPRISYINQQIAGKLTLDVEVPLLHIRGGIPVYWRFVATTLHVDLGLVPPEGRSDSVRERIGQPILGGNSVRRHCKPFCAETIDEEVVGSVVPADINRQIKNSVASSDNR